MTADACRVTFARAQSPVAGVRGTTGTVLPGAFSTARSTRARAHPKRSRGRARCRFGRSDASAHRLDDDPAEPALSGGTRADPRRHSLKVGLGRADIPSMRLTHRGSTVLRRPGGKRAAHESTGRTWRRRASAHHRDPGTAACPIGARRHPGRRAAVEKTIVVAEDDHSCRSALPPVLRTERLPRDRGPRRAVRAAGRLPALGQPGASSTSVFPASTARTCWPRSGATVPFR